MRVSRFIHLILWALLLALPEAAAQVHSLGELPNLKVNDFFQDSEGYVWRFADREPRPPD